MVLMLPAGKLTTFGGSFIVDDFGLASLDRMNEDMVTWECDYPHSDSTWPTSPEGIELSVAGLTDARIDSDDQPHKSAGFLTGVPAPVGAGLAFLPFYLWTETGYELLRQPVLMALWLTLIAVLMISNLPTLSWGSLRPRKAIRLPLIAFTGLAFAALLLEPWWTLAAICTAYLALMPYGLVKYSRIKRRRGQEAAAAAARPDAA